MCKDIYDIVTPIKVQKLQQLLIATEYNHEKTVKLIEGFTDGFDLGYRGPINRKNSSANLPITIGSHQEIWTKLMKEVKLGRHAGPFPKIPFDDKFIQSPIGLVPEDTGTKARLIFHLSFDFKLPDDTIQRSVNYHTPEHLCKVKYKDLDQAIRACLQIKQQVEAGLWDHIIDGYQDFELFYSKTDVVSAFRILPMRPGQRCWLLLKAKHPITQETMYFVDKCLPFGSSISCVHFQAFSDTIAHIGEKTMQYHLSLTIYVPITNYLDDFLFIAMLKRLCELMIRNFMQVCDQIGCPLSADKTEWPTTRIIFLGMLLDGQHLTISIPQQKITKAVNIINHIKDKRKVKIKEIQQMTGLLNFFHRAIIQGRAFTRRMYDKIKVKGKDRRPLKNHHHVRISNDVVQDCEIWLRFLRLSQTQASNICRPFVDFELTQTVEQLNFFTDTSRKSTFGMGAVFDNRWIVYQWNQDFIESQEPSIEFLELYALTAAILTWSADISNMRVCVFCDNESVVHMVNSTTSKCPQCMKLIRMLVLDRIIHNRRLFVKHVLSKNNGLADSLSRMQFKCFWGMAPHSMNMFPDSICSDIYPVKKIWFNEFL